MPAVEGVAEVPVVEVPEQVKDVEEDVIIPGPAMTKEFNEKKLKTIIKEGGKRGVEIEGAADMGGLQFFCTMIEKPEGDLDLLVESVKAMNAKSDPSEEERKGGAGKLGKIVFSFTEEKISAVAYVPKDKADQCSATEWLKDVCLNVANKEVSESVQTFEGVDGKYWAGVCIKQDSEKNLFPIKMRDPAISMAYNYLKARGLFPDGNDDEDDDEMVFGDDDFP
jgi:hypothetical protein